MISEYSIIKDWRKIDISFGLIFPNVYKIGMSSYSVRLLYFLINSYRHIVCERIFLPDIKIKFPATKDYISGNLIRSIENKVLPKDFDILGFSIHSENDFKNILWILDKAKIPLTAQERQDSNIKRKCIYPLIIGGGPVVTSNPLPFCKIFDLLFIGDSESNLGKFFNLFQNYKNEKYNYIDFLEKAKLIEGLFIPLLNNKVQRAILKNLDESPNPTFQLISKSSDEKPIFENNFFIEINRGCPFKCKFCTSSFHNAPFRNKSYEHIIKIIEEGIKVSNFETVSLIGSCVSSHPNFIQICEFIIDKGKRLTIPSIRVEHITPKIIEILEKGDIRTITIAPETGSEDLRYAIGKFISNERIMSVIAQIRDSNIKNIKFYFLIGLPNENENDIDAIINLLKSIDKLDFEKNTLRVNINPFIPKLNTPYEKEVDFYFEEKKSILKSKFKKLKQELNNIPSIKIKFKNYNSIINNAKLQTLISLGDHKTSSLLINYYQKGSNFGALKSAEKEIAFSFNNYLLKIKNCYSPWVF
ncbi:MAG: B12-binding domain-containing radical SAM protein [Promethearchaeota archaeon]